MVSPNRRSRSDASSPTFDGRRLAPEVLGDDAGASGEVWLDASSAATRRSGSAYGGSAMTMSNRSAGRGWRRAQPGDGVRTDDARTVAREMRPRQVVARSRPPRRDRARRRRPCAAPRESASMPAAPDAGEEIEDVRAGQVRFEDREQRLLDPVAQRPRRLARGLETDAARGPGDDPTGVSHAFAMRRARRRVSRRDPAQPACLELGGESRLAAGPFARPGRGAPRRGPGANGEVSVLLACSDATRSRGKPLWARPRTSPSLPELEVLLGELEPVVRLDHRLAAGLTRARRWSPRRGRRTTRRRRGRPGREAGGAGRGRSGRPPR